ncbi:inverted formin-2-like [Sphaeramia orbicularis]|uniref:inverted formin-2-like n=1 Tax=Sphaeramia orbicularis TaxID=375764 RepID=UPI00117FBC9B|nr:inverted formin-2-like [Sphaeramia orbicularis]
MAIGSALQSRLCEVCWGNAPFPAVFTAFLLPSSSLRPSDSAPASWLRPAGHHQARPGPRHHQPEERDRGFVPPADAAPAPQALRLHWGCWESVLGLDGRVVVVLVTVAGAVILLLLYRLLQLRHRLRLARARHALEYYGFYHSATYRLRHPTLSDDLPTKNGAIPDMAPPLQTVTSVTPVVVTPLPLPLPLPLPPPPPSPVLPPPPLPPPPSHPPTPPILPVTLSLPLPLPMIHTTPPSPHLSWGACSDADVYSRIGAFRPSRLSSLSGQSKVILFEHSSL